LASRAAGKEKKKKKSGSGEWAAREGGGRGKGFSFFLNSFKIHFSNFQTLLKQETMHSNHDAQALIISNFIKVIFKYFQSQFYLTI
jgi:hypothetical protein